MMKYYTTKNISEPTCTDLKKTGIDWKQNGSDLTCFVYGDNWFCLMREGWETFIEVNSKICCQNIGHTVIHMLSFFMEKIISPSASAWHPSLLAHTFNYKLTLSISHGQTRLKPTQYGVEGFLQEWRYILQFVSGKSQTFNLTPIFLKHDVKNRLQVYGDFIITPACCVS